MQHRADAISRTAMPGLALQRLRGYNFAVPYLKDAFEKRKVRVFSAA